MTLREQLWEIGKRWIGEEFVKHVAFPRLICALAEHIVENAIPENNDVLAVRTALRMFRRNPGFVSMTEPGVGEPK